MFLERVGDQSADRSLPGADRHVPGLPRRSGSQHSRTGRGPVPAAPPPPAHPLTRRHENHPQPQHQKLEGLSPHLAAILATKTIFPPPIHFAI